MLTLRTFSALFHVSHDATQMVSCLMVYFWSFQDVAPPLRRHRMDATAVVYLPACLPLPPLSPLHLSSPLKHIWKM